MTTSPASQTAQVPHEAPDSFQALLRSKRTRQAMQRRRVFELPGFDGLLGMRARSADASAMFADVAATMDDSEINEETVGRVMHDRAALVARSCVEIVCRREAGAGQHGWNPLADELGDGGGPVRFDQRLCEFLGVDLREGDGSVEAVRYAVPYDMNFAGLYMELIAWFGAENPLDDDELVGESSGSR